MKQGPGGYYTAAGKRFIYLYTRADLVRQDMRDSVEISLAALSSGRAKTETVEHITNWAHRSRFLRWMEVPPELKQDSLDVLRLYRAFRGIDQEEEESAQ